MCRNDRLLVSAAQRESLFWSKRQEIEKSLLDAEALNGFMVCNKDCERDDVKVSLLQFTSITFCLLECKDFLM